MRRFLFVMTILIPVLGFFVHNAKKKNQSPEKGFRIAMPFDLTRDGIFIDSYWGRDKIRMELMWDNNSPTWLNEESANKIDPSSKSRTTYYSTTTADGSAIRGNVYDCDTVRIGDAGFNHIPFYEIADQMTGAIGESIIAKGVWEINFKNKQIIFTSSSDSLSDLRDAVVFPSRFTSAGIKVPIAFRNVESEYLDLDFGFNGSILIPSSEFMEISNGNALVRSTELRFSTPGSRNDLQVTEAYDTIQSGNTRFWTFISSHALARAKLIGCGFFERFEFVIFDYRKELFYVSKRKSFQ